MKKNVTIAWVSVLLLGFAGIAQGRDAMENSRYIIHGGEVFDKQTNLTWQRCSVGQRWREGFGCEGPVNFYYLKDAVRLGDGVWRLPSENELLSLVDKNQKRNIDEKVFPNMGSGDPVYHYLEYWTGTPINNQPGNIHIIINDNGNSLGSYHPSFAFAVRLVRSGQ